MRNKSCLRNVLLVDLENCISDSGHRMKYLKTNKEKFNNEFINDKCDKSISDFINIYYNNSFNLKVVIISSRREIFRKDSEIWLNKNKIVYDELIMQKDNDKKTAVEYKFDFINNNKSRIIMAIEDSINTCKFYKENFIPVIKVKHCWQCK